MSKSTSSNQVFNVGDYVRTSKGKIGVIEKPEGYSIGYYNKQHNFVETDFHQEKEVAEFLAYSSFVGETVFVPNQVKLGSKVYPIWSDKLTKLDKLTIKTQNGSSQHTVTLPIDEAKLLMGIYTRNNIWFTIV